MDAILGLDSAEDFENLVARRPEVLSRQTEEWISGMQHFEAFEFIAEMLSTLIRDARADPQQAWGRYDAAMKRAQDVGTELEPELALIDAALKAELHEEVIQRVGVALPRARGAGLGVSVGMMRSQRAGAYLHRRKGDRAENLERAIADYAAASTLVVSKEQRAEVLMHAGIAFLERVRGDRAENIEQAIALMREGLAEVDEVSPADLNAVLRTNLATALIRRQRGDRAESLREAVTLCDTALDYRSPERNADDWAFSQLNLGDALEQLGAMGSGEDDRALQAYEAVVAEAGRIRQTWLLGAAHYSIGRFLRKRAHPSTQETLEAAVEGKDLEVDRELLGRARGHLEAARNLVEEAPNYLLPGRVANELATILASLGDEGDEALSIAEEALSVLRPTAAPDECANAGYRLGGILAARGHWEEAAQAYRDAVQGAELGFHSRLETASREADTREVGTLFRWAAFAIAAAGEPLEAALVLESGRTREFRRRLGLERREAARVDELPDDIAHAYRTAVGDLANAPLGGSAGRELQETLDVIRSISGFENFGGAAQPDDLAAAVEPRWPLVYVNPTPWGTVLLCLEARDDPSHPEASAHFVGPNALTVYLRMMAGDAASDLSLMDTEEPSSYLALVAGVSDRPPEQDLKQALNWLGEEIAAPLRRVAKDAHADGVTIVPCGPISVAALHAAPWEIDSGIRTCLIDDLEVRYAQSALIVGAGLKRARERDGDTASLVALANPTRDLDAAEPEVAEISKHFAADRRAVAEGAGANADFLRGYAPEASHLHFACHGRGGLLDPEAPAAVLLADGWVPATVLTELSLRSRLVVVSACQSALASLVGSGDEAISIGSVMIAAGSACAIASLWKVHDLATALLMTRMYEELFGDRRRPPEALRRAQHWLRELDPTTERTFLDRHPALRAEFDARALRDGLPGDRGPATRSPTRPYANEYYWAAFIAVGG
jgi:CHAT domain-containing protein/tetratricopeptide (TPR) repeat protein